jgi:AcrR family transcriptional regulator
MPSADESAGVRDTRPGIGEKGAAPTVFDRAHVDEIQRARLLAAMVEVSSEHGPVDATVARVVARAGVSRRTFYDLFEDRRQCFLAAWEDAVARASARAVPAYERGGDWAERLRLGLTALLRFFEAERDAGRLLIVGSLGGGPAVLERRSHMLARMIAIVDAGRDELDAAAAPPPLTAEGLVGAVVSIVHARMLDGDRSLLELVNPLMSMIVLPYHGAAASHRELAQPVAKQPPGERRSPDAGSLRELQMRLTYRTVRVLLAIGAQPGASNKLVGEVSGAYDQGQISKLLSRLRGFGLIHNDGAGSVRGAPNAWTLTSKGERVVQAMSMQAVTADASTGEQQ